jgi:hypothetical protein
VLLGDPEKLGKAKRYALDNQIDRGQGRIKGGVFLETIA